MDAPERLRRAMLASAIDKVGRKYDRLSAGAKADTDAIVTMKLTVGELRQLKLFHMAFYDEAPTVIGDTCGGGS